MLNSSIDNLRHSIRQRRNNLGAMAQKRAACRVANKLLRSSVYQRSQSIAAYFPISGELSLLYFMKRAWKQGKSCYLPLIRGEGLHFVRFEPLTKMRANPLGIPEPVTGRLIPLKQLDLILLPLVGFDQSCQRIGMGGGFYDRMLSIYGKRKSAYKGRVNASRPALVGVAHRCQKIQSINTRPWDVPLDQVISV